MKKLILVSSGVLIVVLVSAWAAVNGLASVKWLRSTPWIRAELLADIPFGSSFESVKEFLEIHGYTIVSSSDQTGFLSRENQEVGEAHIRARLGGYRLFITRTDIAAFFAFNEDGELSEVDVRKYRDAP